MNKKDYTQKQVEESLQKHPDFPKVRGTFALSTTGIALDTNEGITFKGTEDEYHIFIQEIINTALALDNTPAERSIKQWVPQPGIHREELIKKYTDTPEIYKELINDDPHVVVIHKLKDDGRKIFWTSQDGRLGYGATPKKNI